MSRIAVNGRFAISGREPLHPFGFNSAGFNSASPSSGVSGSNTGITASAAFSMLVFFNAATLSGTHGLARIGDNSGSKTGVSLRLSSNTVQIFVGTSGTIPSTMAIQPNTWNIVSARSSGGNTNVLLDLNGITLNGSAPQTLALVNTPFVLGSDFANTSYYTGLLSCAALYNSFLSVAQLQAIATTGVLPTSGLIRWYELSEGSGTVANDSSVTNDPMALTNVTWTANNVPFGLRSNTSNRVLA